MTVVDDAYALFQAKHRICFKDAREVSLRSREQIVQPHSTQVVAKKGLRHAPDSNVSPSNTVLGIDDSAFQDAQTSGTRRVKREREAGRVGHPTRRNFAGATF